MGLTTLFVCFLQGGSRYQRQSTARNINILVFGGSILIALMLTGCSSGGNGDSGNLPDTQGGGSGGSSAAPAGPAVASLAWDPVPDVVGYIIHYGTSTPGSLGSCSYAQSTFSSSPSVTVTGLAADTTYYFAVSAYNGLESACSAELTTITGSA